MGLSAMVMALQAVVMVSSLEAAMGFVMAVMGSAAMGFVTAVMGSATALMGFVKAVRCNSGVFSSPPTGLWPPPLNFHPDVDSHPPPHPFTSTDFESFGVLFHQVSLSFNFEGAVVAAGGG